MKASLKTGLTGVRRIAIDRERTMAFTGAHARFMVDMMKTVERLKAKAARRAPT
jgi:hypothetical protein